MTENKKNELGWGKRLRTYLISVGKHAKDQANKDDWTEIWAKRNFGTSFGTAHQFLDDMAFLLLGLVIFSFILVFYFYIMIYKDVLFNLTIQMMVDEAAKYGTGFPQVYASLGAAIMICIYILVTVLLLLLRWAPKQDLTEGLADIAHTLEVRLPKNVPGEEEDTIDMNETESMCQELDRQSQTKADEMIEKLAYHDAYSDQ